MSANLGAIDFWRNSIEHYMKALNRQLERDGIERKDRQLQGKWATLSLAENPQERRAGLFAWLVDSLIWTSEEILAERPVYALRGLLQAAGYAGQVGHDAITQDSFLTLRNCLEDCLK